MPDILLADLNMPGMSGIELLAVGWRRFPAIQKIAMGSVYPGNVAPSGVPAEAFFQKGDGVGELVGIIQVLPPGEHHARQCFNPSAPLRIHIDGHAGCSKAFVTIQCPECLCTFSQPVGGPNGFMRATNCIHCGNSIQYAIVDPPGLIRLRQLKRVTSATLRREQN